VSGCGVPWDETTEARWKGSCVAALRLLGDRGRVPGRGGPEALDPSPFLTIFAAADSPPLCRTAAAVKGHRHAAPTGKMIPRDSLCEGGTVAVLRTDWGRGAVRLLLDFSAPRHHLEIAVGDRLVVTGEWGWSVDADGVPLLPTGPWTVCCFESDAKASFLEIVAPLPGGLQAERQIVLLPRDRVLVLTDSITDAGACLPAEGRPGRLAYRSHLPLAEAGASREEETRELRIRVGKRQAWRVLPLALPEWRAAASTGLCDEDGDVVRLRGDGEGKPSWPSLYAICTMSSSPPCRRRAGVASSESWCVATVRRCAGCCVGWGRNPLSPTTWPRTPFFRRSRNAPSSGARAPSPPGSSASPRACT
jgi:hypothetical protein